MKSDRTLGNYLKISYLDQSGKLCLKVHFYSVCVRKTV